MHTWRGSINFDIFQRNYSTGCCTMFDMISLNVMQHMCMLHGFGRWPGNRHASDRYHENGNFSISGAQTGRVEAQFLFLRLFCACWFSRLQTITLSISTLEYAHHESHILGCLASWCRAIYFSLYIISHDLANDILSTPMDGLTQLEGSKMELSTNPFNHYVPQELINLDRCYYVSIKRQ